MSSPSPSDKSLYRKIGKRLMDLCLSVLLFSLLLPLFLLLYIVLALHFRGNPIFSQERPGKNGVVFRILKFKTMVDRWDSSGHLLPDSERLTSIGKVVRKFSLDEIPQLINVIKGDMSLIGPRPLLVEYLSLYSEDQFQRHQVRPGVTGWAQINGRNTISWEEKFLFDLWYIQHYDFLFDLRILSLTFYNVIRGKGVSQRGHVSMGKFTGSQANRVEVGNQRLAVSGEKLEK